LVNNPILLLPYRERYVIVAGLYLFLSISHNFYLIAYVAVLQLLIVETAKEVFFGEDY
jgi:hypothetical protein